MNCFACRLHSTLLAAALLLPLAAGAQDAPHRPPPCGPGMPHERGGPGEVPPPFLRGIELGQAQKDKVAAILQAQAPLLREQHQIVSSAHDALHGLTLAARFDEAKAAALAQTAAQAMAKASLQLARSEQQIVALLNPEQRKQVEPRSADGPRRPPRPQ